VLIPRPIRRHQRSCQDRGNGEERWCNIDGQSA